LTSKSRIVADKRRDTKKKHVKSETTHERVDEGEKTCPFGRKDRVVDRFCRDEGACFRGGREECPKDKTREENVVFESFHFVTMWKEIGEI